MALQQTAFSNSRTRSPEFIARFKAKASKEKNSVKPSQALDRMEKIAPLLAVPISP
jgi:hypothetical protein